MIKTVAIDFEAIPSKIVPGFKAHHQEPVELGLYSKEFHVKEWSTYIKPDKQVHFTKWQEKNTPHITPEILENAPYKCSVARDFFYLLDKECSKGCKILTYGNADNIWLGKLFENCVIKEKLERKFDVIVPTDFKITESNKPKLILTDVLQEVWKEKPEREKNNLEKVYNDMFPDSKLKNHVAVNDARMCYEIYKELHK